MTITNIDQLDPDKYYTYQDYMTWRFSERVELFLGRIFKMSPGPNLKHQRISGDLYVLLHQLIQSSQCQVFSAPFDVCLPISKKKNEKDTVVQPDITVICDPNKLDKQGCNGAPDIVIEILSPGNSKREMKDKFELYEASRVPEYWIVDPYHEDVIIYSLNEKREYIGSKPFVIDDQLTSEVLSDIKIKLSEIFKT